MKQTARAKAYTPETAEDAAAAAKGGGANAAFVSAEAVGDSRSMGRGTARPADDGANSVHLMQRLTQERLEAEAEARGRWGWGPSVLFIGVSCLLLWAGLIALF